MTIEDVLKALDRYTRESNESDRRTAAMLGIKRATLIAWLQGIDRPKKCILARLAGFLRHPDPFETLRSTWETGKVS